VSVRVEQCPLRSDDEIIRAHDLLTGVLMDGLVREMVFDGPDSERDIAYAIRASNVLCWVLNHRHNHAFGKMLEGLERKVRALGMEVVRE
jgi:hypothetical protein